MESLHPLEGLPRDAKIGLLCSTSACWWLASWQTLHSVLTNNVCSASELHLTCSDTLPARLQNFTSQNTASRITSKDIVMRFLETGDAGMGLLCWWPGAKGFGSKRRKWFRWPSFPLDLRKWQGRVRFQCTQGLAGGRGWDKAGSGVLCDLFLTTSTTIGEWQWDKDILLEYLVAQLFDDDGLCSRLSYMWRRVEDSKWKTFFVKSSFN